MTRSAFRVYHFLSKSHLSPPIKVVIESQPPSVCSQVSPQVFRLGGECFGRWWNGGLTMNFELDWWKSAWPMLEFVTLRSEFCDTYFCVCDTHFRDLGGGKKIRVDPPNFLKLQTTCGIFFRYPRELRRSWKINMNVFMLRMLKFTWFCYAGLWNISISDLYR